MAQVNGHTNGDSVSSDTPQPLNIVVVGAGIAGLTAAIGLRRNGHNVTVRPSSIQKNAHVLLLTDIRFTNNQGLPMNSELRFTLHQMPMASCLNLVSTCHSGEQTKCAGFVWFIL